MKFADYEKLPFRQQLTVLIAMHVRNSMEDFHVEHLSDTQMKELNQIIRQAIYDVLGLIDTKANSLEESESTAAWLVRMVPPYWEIPDKSSGSLKIK